MGTRKMNEAKVIAWTATIRAEFSGPITGCAIELFCMLTPKQRKIALEQMQKYHEEHPEKEPKA